MEPFIHWLIQCLYARPNVGNRCTKTNMFSATVEIKAWKKRKALTYFTPLETSWAEMTKEGGREKGISWPHIPPLALLHFSAFLYSKTPPYRLLNGCSSPYHLELSPIRALSLLCSKTAASILLKAMINSHLNHRRHKGCWKLSQSRNERFFLFNQSSILYTSVYICQSQSPNSAHHHPHPTAVFPPWCP